MESKKLSHFDDLGRFIFRSYDEKRPFSSFLPGIGGLYGVPMWVFYTNRGQAITSFGVESKDHPIMEFQSANKVYQLTTSLGFRTFIKGDDWFSEPFSPRSSSNTQRDMTIGMNEVEIFEQNFQTEIETRVIYYNILNEDFAALVRNVTFRNLSHQSKQFSVLDGMPVLTPYGVNNDILKNIGRTIEAWMRVDNLESRIPFFRLKASASDSSEINMIKGGNFSLGIHDGRFLLPIVDPITIFGNDTSFSYPHQLDNGLEFLLNAKQVTEGRSPCSFFGSEIQLAPSETHAITSIYGYLGNKNDIEKHTTKFLSQAYFSNKLKDSRKFFTDLTEPIATRSGIPQFDAYSRQTFLDNLIRGGWPEILEDKHVYYVYSRKHGDPERDYNHFVLSPEFYSQGNSNYRDVIQNRRNDIKFEPRVQDYNIRLFVSLIQTDGYNPLIVKGVKFSIPPSKQEELNSLIKNPDAFSIELPEDFSLGELLQHAIDCGLKVPPEKFLNRVFNLAYIQFQAEFGEGYWVDHWTYLLDLIESYLEVFPDRKSSLLYTSDPLPFFDSPIMVNPRNKKYVLENGTPYQLNAISEDEGKRELISSRSDQKSWVRTYYGKGDIFRVSVISKLVMLAILKFSTLDPNGMGIEMEAGRPGWCDALNGLPGLFGSSLSETFELIRLINFLVKSLSEENREIELPVEIEDLLSQILKELNSFENDFDYWNNVSAAREDYRQKTRFGVSGNLATLSSSILKPAFIKMIDKLSIGTQNAITNNDGIPPTYFYYELSDYEALGESDNNYRMIVHPKQFKQHKLPIFLEGPVHYLKTLDNKAQAKSFYEKVKQSELFDRKLKMYKLNTSLMNEPFEIGRARAFSPGWLENESIWLHMSYKYLLELLKAGLYQEFFNELDNSLPPFMDPAVYGRSPLENSSFIVSSVHPDQNLHGAGFIARLTGSTAEFLSIWHLLTAGEHTFSVDENEALTLRLHPILPGSFFTKEGKFSFNYLQTCSVTYHNPDCKDTFSPGVIVKKYILLFENGEEITVSGKYIPAPFAEQVRNNEVQKINVFIG